MKTYLEALKVHPGVPVASVMTVLMPAAGLLNENDPILASVAGLVLAMMAWFAVLATVYQNWRVQPDPETDNE